MSTKRKRTSLAPGQTKEQMFEAYKAALANRPAPKKKAATNEKESATDAYGNTWSRIIRATPKQLAAASAALGVQIPKDLAELLTRFGGGKPVRNYYANREYGIEVSVGYLLPFADKGKVSGLATTCLSYRKAQQLSQDLVPFALDSGHANLLCLRLPKADVVYWLHDDSEDRVRKVAPSLENFLAGLSEAPF